MGHIDRSFYLEEKDMMTYEEFKDVVVEKLPGFFPKRYADAKLSVGRQHKINVTLDSLSFIPDGSSASTTIYFEHIYQDYLENGDLNYVLARTVRALVSGAADCSSMSEIISEMKTVKKDNITFRLINTEQNRELLSEVPSREFNDLSIVYYEVMSLEAGGTMSALISNSMAEYFGYDEEQLFQLALENTRKMFPPKRMQLCPPGMECVEDILVLTNEKMDYGAASVLYTDELQAVANIFGSDLYILPSRLHEVLLLSAEFANPEALAQMVLSVNSTAVPLKDRLSNQVYHFSRETQQVTLATDTPYKRLDNLPTEGMGNSFFSLADDSLTGESR